MEIKFENYKLKGMKSIINLEIEHKKITGLIGNNNDRLLELLSLNTLGTGSLTINDIKITKKNFDPFNKRVKIVEEEINYNYFLPTIKDIMVEEIKINNIKLEDYNKKMRDSLKIVGLSRDYLNRSIITLSGYEKKLVLLAISLISNPTLLIIKEPFKGMDLNHKKALLRFYNIIKDKYKKTIIFVSNDSNMLYENTENIIFAEEDEIKKVANTNDFFKDIDYLKENKIDIPDSIEFIYLVEKKKEIKLTYYKDVRDILKDIYKHV